MLETDKQIYLYRYRLLDPDVDIDIFEASNFELESHNLLCLVWTVIVRAGSCMIHQQADLAEQWVYGLASHEYYLTNLLCLHGNTSLDRRDVRPPHHFCLTCCSSKQLKQLSSGWDDWLEVIFHQVTFAIITRCFTCLGGNNQHDLQKDLQKAAFAKTIIWTSCYNSSWYS